MTLSTRIEQAGEGSRELDMAICLALNTGRRTYPRNPGPDHFTTSLDAAMTLVPEDHFWSITMRGVSWGGYSACCQIEGECLVWIDASTPALAICAAALRARGL